MENSNIIYWLVRLLVNGMKQVPLVGAAIEFVDDMRQDCEEMEEKQNLEERARQLEEGMECTPEKARHIALEVMTEQRRAGIEISKEKEEAILDIAEIIPIRVSRRVQKILKQANINGTKLSTVLPIDPSCTTIQEREQFYRELLPSRRPQVQTGGEVSHKMAKRLAKLEKQIASKGDLGKNIPCDVWENSRIVHEGESILDMASLVWQNLPWKKQREYARQYQSNYAQAKNLQVSCIFTEKGVAFPMRLIPPGKFLIGSPSNELRQEDNETQAEVILSQAIYLGETEITQKQWQGIMGSNPSHFKGENLPVEKINWEDCITFCGKLGEGFRLPSEYEWEYACRAGTTTPFNIGPNISPNTVNYNGKFPYNNAARGEYLRETVACGSMGHANAWWLYDMHGNVWEWCLDEWGKPYTSCVQNSNCILLNQFQNVSPANRVIRGGSWDISATCCRSAYRGYSKSSSSYCFISFRLVRFLP